MQTHIQILSPAECGDIHERTLGILERTGLRVDTEWGRRILRQAGAVVDETTHIVRFPRALVEQALRLAPRQFSLGARRPGADLPMNAGQCTMMVDGEAMFILDAQSGVRRPATMDDWRTATRLIDAIDEVGVYWRMVEASDGDDSPAGLVSYWTELLRNFSKHIQDPIKRPEEAPWLLEVLQVAFGDQQTIRQQHPYSFLLCPQSPLVIEGPYTDAYLALLGWDIPVAVMPMPLMGATAPASLVSTIVLGNCEVLAMLCLIEAAAPGTPFIYAPALAVIDPRSGSYSGGAMEEGLLGAATTAMARHYGLPVITTGLGTDHQAPSIQAGYERALTGLLPMLTWPDILVGPGLLGGSMNLCLEQLLIDVETFRLCRRAHEGISSAPERWLDEVIERVGPGGDFLSERSTARAVRSGEWYVSRLGLHDTYESWQAAGQPDLLAEVRAQIDEILATHQPLPLDEDAECELQRIQQRAAGA